MNCQWCGEPVENNERHPSFQTNPTHFECGFRAMVGSVAHILRCCHCFVPGSTLEDPPRLTKREAARAALELFRQIDEWYSETAMQMLRNPYAPH